MMVLAESIATGIVVHLYNMVLWILVTWDIPAVLITIIYYCIIYMRK